MKSAWTASMKPFLTNIVDASRIQNSGWTMVTVLQMTVVSLVVLLAGAPQSVASDHLSRSASSFDRHFVANPSSIERVRKTGTLSGASGWFEYDVSVLAEGWYEFILDTSSAEGEFTISERASGIVVARFLRSFQTSEKTSKLSNVYLKRGDHVVRLAHEFWTGHKDLTGFSLIRNPDSLASTLRVIDQKSPLQRKGSCEPLQIQSGPRTSSTVLNVVVSDAASNATIGRTQISIPPSQGVVVENWTPPCERAGNFVLYFTHPSEKVTNRDIPPYSYQVYDTSPISAAGKAAARTLVHAIVAAKRPPDYESTPSRVTEKPFGSYRESGDSGWVSQQQVKRPGADASWFAYSIANLVPQQLYAVEIDYPDDARRTFQIALREPRPLAYPVAGGVDSGGEYRISNSMQTQTLLFWPRANEARVVFMPLNDGERAAAAAIRVYKVDGALPPVPPGTPDSRMIVNWYEEGTNFVSMFGAPDSRASGTRTAVERWVETAAYQGISMLMPTAVIYESGMFPSVINKHFSRPWLGALGDPLRQIVLAAERYGMRVVPELHPRADELQWPFRESPNPKPNLLLSRNGQSGGAFPPMFNLLHSNNQQWYVDLIGELVDQLKESPSFGGVSLRVMGWRTPTLNNFYSLDWGYDDLSVAQFEKDTGTKVPVSDTSAARYQLRYAWLMTNARERWIAWRCAKVAELLTRIVARVRHARPDLQVYLPIYPITITVPARPYFQGTDWIREAGIDPSLLSSIDGLVLVNALHMYGRRWDPAINAILRDHLTSEKSRASLIGRDRKARYMTTAVYLESLGTMAPPEALGFPAGTPRGYTSAVANPPGRIYLERFATLLAENDAVMLGDGGNAFTVGQPELREFSTEYRTLPAVPFEQRSSGQDPIVVRELSSGGSRIFYLVNRSDRAATATLRFRGPTQVTRITTKESVEVSKQTLAVRLQPYQLLTFKMPSSAAIVRVTSTHDR